jgi:opacity protein-like surface antigen
MRKYAWFLAAILVAAVPAVSAQTKEPIVGYFGIGYDMTLGTTSDYMEDGWDFNGGVIFHPSPSGPIGIRLDLGYHYWDATSELLKLGQSATSNWRIDDGNGSVWSLTADALWEFGGNGKMGGYVGVGIGGYKRRVELTQTALETGYWCDPWWGWCYPATFVGEEVTDSDTVTKFGYNAALGITFPVGEGELYLEARYHRMDTPTATEFLPFIIGYKF